MKHQGTYIAGVWDLHKCSESVFEKGPIENRATHVSADIYLSLVTGPHPSWNTHVEDLAIAVLWAKHDAVWLCDVPHGALCTILSHHESGYDPI